MENNDLAGQDLGGKKLPKETEFPGLESLKQASETFQKTLFGKLILCLAFAAGLSALDYEAYFVGGHQIGMKLPYPWVNVNVTGFLIIGSILIGCYTLALHFFIRRLWEEWQQLPSRFPDGSWLRQKMIPAPWIEAVTLKNPNLWRKNISWRARLVIVFVMIGLAIPILLIFYAWLRILPFQSRTLSTWFVLWGLVLSASWGALCLRRLIQVVWRRLDKWKLGWALVFLLALVPAIIGTLGLFLNPAWLNIVLAVFWLILVGLNLRYCFFKPESDFEKKKVDSSEFFGTLNSGSYREVKKKILGTLLFIVTLLFAGATLHDHLFNSLSQKWSKLQAPLDRAQLSLKLENFVPDGDYETNRLRVEPIKLASKHLNGANLSGAFFFLGDLSDSTLKRANLTETDLRGGSLLRAELDRATFKGSRLDFLDAQGVTFIDVELDYASMVQANFREVCFERVSMSQTHVSLVDMTGAALVDVVSTSGAQFQNIRILNSSLQNVTMQGAVFDAAAEGLTAIHSDLRGSHFFGCYLAGADFSFSNLENTVFANARLNGYVRFFRTNLAGAVFSEAQLEYVDFQNSIKFNQAFIEEAHHLKNCNFSGLTFEQKRFRNGSIFEGSKFEKSELIDVVLVGANFKGTDLTDTFIYISNLSALNLSEGAVLHRTKIQYSNLHGANLSGADILALDLTGSNLNGVDLAGITNFDDPVNPWKVVGAWVDNSINNPEFVAWARKNGAVMTEEDWKKGFAKNTSGAVPNTWKLKN